MDRERERERERREDGKKRGSLQKKKGGEDVCVCACWYLGLFVWGLI